MAAAVAAAGVATVAVVASATNRSRVRLLANGYATACTPGGNGFTTVPSETQAVSVNPATISSGSRQVHRAVVVAVVAVRMVQVASDQVIDVIAVRHRLVATTGTVNVILVVAGTAVARRTLGRVGRVHRQSVLVDHAATVLMVQMAVVQVIDVSLVDDSRMATLRAVLVRMVLVRWVRMAHRLTSFFA